MSAAASPEDDLEHQAALWLMRLQSQPTSTRLLRACELWRGAAPAHERAWQELQHSYGLLQQRIQRLPDGGSALAVHALDRAGRVDGRRRAMGSLAAVALVAVPAAWLVRRQLPWQRVGADYATATGERREVQLPDGTRLTLNTDSAVRIRFDGVQRLLLLDRGEIFVQSGADPHSRIHRPLRVQTAQGLLEALGTRFSVRLLPDHAPPASRLGVDEGAVSLQPLHAATPQRPTVARAGQRYLMTATGVSALRPYAMDIHGWTDGLLVVEDMRLADFLAEVARYRPGHLGWDDDVAELRISGTYLVGDTTRLLQLVAETLPIRVAHRTRFWTRIRRAEPG